MPDKYLVEFIAQWIRDEDLRSKVLREEVTEMADWGLDANQSADLRSLDKDRIRDRMLDELTKDLGIDLDQILQDFAATGGQGGAGGSAGSGYEEGNVHVRGVVPTTVKSGLESVVVVRGHGWEENVEIVFVPAGGGAEVVAERLDLGSDVDVWQRVTVKVTLPDAGTWQLVAKVPGKGDSSENVQVEAE